MTELLAFEGQMPSIWLDENSQFGAFDAVQLAKGGVTRRIIAAIKEQVRSGQLQ